MLININWFLCWFFSERALDGLEELSSSIVKDLRRSKISWDSKCCYLITTFHSSHFRKLRKLQCIQDPKNKLISFVFSNGTGRIHGLILTFPWSLSTITYALEKQQVLSSVSITFSRACCRLIWKSPSLKQFIKLDGGMTWWKSFQWTWIHEIMIFRQKLKRLFKLNAQSIEISYSDCMVTASRDEMSFIDSRNCFPHYHSIARPTDIDDSAVRCELDFLHPSNESNR